VSKDNPVDGSWARAFRAVLGHYPTGVTAVTALDGEPIGMTIGSFSSISLEPMLVGFFVDSESSTWPRIQRAGAFAVNVLADDQHELCRVFATRGADRFANTGWTPGLDGVPLLDGAVAWIECELLRIVDAGDHELAIGTVRRVQEGPGRPIVFYRGEYSRLAPGGELPRAVRQ
jgi:flavin reductase (DIM6/NTAB) family NADH-FMN oxidoreductase RutF